MGHLTCSEVTFFDMYFKVLQWFFSLVQLYSWEHPFKKNKIILINHTQWINEYNCVVQAAYNIGGHIISANTIEQSIFCFRTPRLGRVLICSYCKNMLPVNVHTYIFTHTHTCELLSGLYMYEQSLMVEYIDRSK